MEAHHTDHTSDEPLARDTRFEATRPPPPIPIMVEDGDWADEFAEIRSFTSSQYQPPVNVRPGLQYFETLGYKHSLTERILLEDSQVLNFNGLSELTILDLQNQISQIQLEVFHTWRLEHETIPFDMRRLEDLLHRYITAIRDYEYMMGLQDTDYPAEYLQRLYRHFRPCYSDKGPGLPITALPGAYKRLPKKVVNSDPLRDTLRKILPKSLTWSLVERKSRINEFMEGEMPLTVVPFVDRLARFIVAMTGGLSLVVPMLIMRIHQDTTKSLITTSVAVLLFSGIVSVGFKASNSETLGITAAYAAVLVVFVGTST